MSTFMMNLCAWIFVAAFVLALVVYLRIPAEESQVLSFCRCDASAWRNQTCASVRRQRESGIATDIDLLAAALRQYENAGSVSCERCASQNRGSTTEAICIHLDHGSKEAIACYLPYTWKNDSHETGEIFGQSTLLCSLSQTPASKLPHTNFASPAAV